MPKKKKKKMIVREGFFRGRPKRLEVLREVWRPSKQTKIQLDEPSKIERSKLAGVGSQEGRKGAGQLPLN